MELIFKYKGIIGIEFITSIFIYFAVFLLIIISFIFMQESIYNNLNSEAETLTVSSKIQYLIQLENKLPLSLNEFTQLLNNLKIKYQLDEINASYNNSYTTDYGNIILKRMITINGKIYELKVLK